MRIKLHIWSVLPLVLSACGLGWSAASHADTVPTRLILKWKDTAAHSRVQALAQTSERLATRTGHHLQHRRSLDERLEVLQLETHLEGGELNDALNQLRSDSRVDYVVEDQRRHILGLTNDPLITARSGRTGQWYLNSIEAAAINAMTAWDTSQGGGAGNGVIVAVVDTGVRLDHPDLTSKLLPGYDFVSCDQQDCTQAGVTYLTANDNNGWDNDPSDPGDWISSADLQAHPTVFDSTNCSPTPSSWHGTRVAGIIGAATNNSVGIAGIGYNARILPVRVLGKCGGYDSDIIAGMKWAAGLHVNGVVDNPPANQAKIINMSLGSAGTCSPAYQDAINQIIGKGVSIVISAGNEGGPLDTPANCSGVISVVGVRNVGSKVGYSSLGNASIAAPAGNCVNLTGPCLFSIDTTTNFGTTTPLIYNPGDTTTYYTDQTNYNLGTSFSSPIVSGTIALMLGNNPTLTPSVIQTRLQATAKAFPTVSGVSACHIPTSSTDIQSTECNCSRATCGAGLTDANAAVRNATLPITPYIRGPTAVTVGDSVILDAAGSTLTDPQATYTWSLQSGNATLSSTTGSSITVTAPSTAGAIALSLDISDGNGNTATLSHNIIVYGPPIPRITSSTTSVAAGQILNLSGTTSSAQDGGYLTYAWSTTAGALSARNSASTAFIAPTTTNVATVMLTVTDQEGGSATQSVTFSVTGTSSVSSSSSASANSGSGTNSSSGGGVLNSQLLLLLLSLACFRKPHAPTTKGA